MLSSGGFDDVCLFYKKIIKVNQKKQYLTTCTLDSAETFIKDLIKGHQDGELATKASHIDFHAKRVRYHNKCRYDYADSLKKRERAKKRDLNLQVYEEFHEKVEEEVVRGSKALLARDLYGIFSLIWAHDDKKRCDLPCFRTVFDGLLTHFGNKHSFVTPSKKLGLIIYSSKITEKEAIWMVKQGMIDAK